jgi:hypothetical protein
VLLTSHGYGIVTGTAILVNVQSTHSYGFAVLDVAVYPKIESPQSDFADQSDSTAHCEVKLLVAVSKRKNQFRRGL